MAERYIAAIGLAIHSAINAADAVCGAWLGKRAAGEAHDQALVLLRQAGHDGSTVEKELRRLLPLKAKTEYEPDDIATGVATRAAEVERWSSGAPVGTTIQAPRSRRAQGTMHGRPTLWTDTLDLK